jgi:hypothetical protein
MRWQCEYTPDCEPKGGSVSDNANTPQTASPKEAASATMRIRPRLRARRRQRQQRAASTAMDLLTDFSFKIVISHLSCVICKFLFKNCAFMCSLADGFGFHCCISGGVLKYVASTYTAYERLCFKGTQDDEISWEKA